MAQRNMPRAPRRHGTTVILLLAVITGMGGLTAASVPLYRIFCAATGYGGTTERASAAPTNIANAVVTVRFNTEIDSGLDWEFRPLVAEVQVHPGEQKQVFFRAKNLSSHGITGRAVYNVTPTKTGIYFDKLQCFCFEEQKLAAGETVDMPVFFFIDPEFCADPAMKGIDTVTLSYTFFSASPS